MNQTTDYWDLHKLIYEQELDNLTKEQAATILHDPQSPEAEAFDKHVRTLMSKVCLEVSK